MIDAVDVPHGKVRSLLSSPFAMVAAALAIRLVVMGFVYTSQLDPAQDHWAFGCEMGRVARAIATGQGFSSPYTIPTGPTALLPPGYPFLLACVFKLFGVYTTGSALAILTLNNLFSSFTCLPLFLIARRVFGTRVASWAGWMWAIFPYSIILSNLWVWETALTTLLMTIIVWATFEIEHSTSYSAWLGYGLLWGIAALTNPAVLSTLPFLGAWILVRHWRRGSRCVSAAMVASLVFLAVVAPWIWRCSETYGRFVAFRGNMGLEILVGNSDDTSNPFNWNVVPVTAVSYNKPELERLIRVGESAWLKEKDREAEELVANRPLRYAELSLRRILYTWTCFWNFNPRPWTDDSAFPNVLTYTLISFLAFLGLGKAIQERRDGVVPLAILVVVFPVVYYLTHPQIRFRHPIDPVIVILCVYGATCLRARKPTLPVQEAVETREKSYAD